MSYILPPIRVQNVSKAFRVYQEEKTIFGKVRNTLTRRAFYEELRVLNNISFTVNKGEMLGVIGRNGSGKTTLLRLIAGIMRPNYGNIYTEGNIVPLLELGTGFDGDLTAQENIVQYGIILGFNPSEIRSKADEILEFSELEKFADTKLRKFSTGMVARLAFSTAAQIQPDILLVDEVLSVGDVTFQQKSLKAFSAFKENRRTILFVSHNLSSIRKLCDRAILLHNGQIAGLGDVENVIETYLGTLSESADYVHETPVARGAQTKERTLPDRESYYSKASYSVTDIKKMIDRHDYSEAIKRLKPMLEKEPANGQLNYLLAFSLHCSQTDYAESLRHYDLALKCGFQEFWVLYGRGSLYREIGDFEAAVSDLKRAIMLNPAHEGPKQILDDVARSISSEA
jgi:ABC-type polysaccharide/polyol phosphate transport system ATPase subunit